MASEKVDISVLVVDDDDTSLAIITNILNSFDYKVLIARGALNALDILREFQGFLDLVITELHISGMDGVEFQKRIENEFQLPVIMMSADRRKSAVAKSLANGAAHFILKPFCQDDFKDIWQHAVAARKRKISIENNEGASLPGGGVFIQDANYAIPSTVNKRKRKYKSSQKNNKEGQSEGKHRLVKKPKIVWTAYLHNIFLLAIKRIGLESK
ncbi:two-component response regulator ARR1 [Cajanus cajan]|nr:two-component response regulator ARR1 [Cajanus cajan]